MKAIIVAAGMGRRLAPYTDDRPKTLVEINGKSILQRQIDAYRAAGIDDIIIVRGYMKELIRVDGARYFDNDRFRENNILASLFYAESAMDGGFLFSYSDIVFRPEVVRTALDTEGDYALVIDRRWHEAYVGRLNHPVEEGEVAKVVGDRVTLVGKKTMPADEATGEFIGLARFSGTAASDMRARYHERKTEYWDKPYGRAPRMQVAYLTDLLNDLIGTGAIMRPAFIDGGWREIDTVEDLERAKPVVSW
ncbi:MAG TPA: phosphocholine cytidylyltransferase family protein [Polyangia bacterium]|jgi:choline kinase|nr:phosphocholine cytidylyltransferase family protein [Polyangia bacterium]